MSIFVSVFGRAEKITYKINSVSIMIVTISNLRLLDISLLKSHANLTMSLGTKKKYQCQLFW